MQTTDFLNELGGLQSVARELGISEADAAAGAAALLPAVLGGFKRQTQSQTSGLDGLLEGLGRLGGEGLREEVLAPRPTNVARGNDVLGQIFGTPQVSRTVAQSAAGRSGLSPDLLRKMLPFLAMLVAGYLSRQAGASAGLGAGAPGAPASAGGGVGGSLGSLLDLDGDGNPLNDILAMAGKLLR